MRDNNKKELILDAAEALLCAASDKDISVEMIAKKAGIGKGSIYYYFESREDIVDAVIERSYSLAVREYFDDVCGSNNALFKIKALFGAVIKQEFRDKRKNIIVSFHVQDNLMLHMKLMMTAVKTISPILTKLLEEGGRDGSLHTDYPEESAEMIVAMLTFLLDKSFFPSDNEGVFRKLKLYAGVLETCLQTERGSFDFLFSPEEYSEEMRGNLN
ncbi:MAG: TetR/AcrR family transcriptional regulator [Oscillospiraceae bacterium]|nr:TetR/AcrR family transcriptional regulator [Oscillospiraceae bacterium]